MLECREFTVYLNVSKMTQVDILKLFFGLFWEGFPKRQ